MGRLVRIGCLIGVHLSLDRRDFAENDLVEARADAAINPPFRQMEQQVPERVSVDQALKQGLQLRPHARQRFQPGKHWKKAFIPHGATLCVCT